MAGKEDARGRQIASTEFGAKGSASQMLGSRLETRVTPGNREPNWTFDRVALLTAEVMTTTGAGGTLDWALLERVQ